MGLPPTILCQLAWRTMDASPDNLIQAALKSIHGKAVYAARKFRLLKTAIDATLLSLGFMVATLVVAIGGRVAA